MENSTTFIRKDFYIQPPPKNASLKEWEKWQKAEEAEAEKHRKSFNKIMRDAELDGTLNTYKSIVPQKIDGIWKQEKHRER